jgi:HD-GYP domain-containing protein (c-di-GMP phosphodiesterase class II)
MDPEYVIRIINSLVNTKFDPTVVNALTRVFQSGKLKLRRAAVVDPAVVPPVVTVSPEERRATANSAD